MKRSTSFESILISREKLFLFNLQMNVEAELVISPQPDENDRLQLSQIVRPSFNIIVEVKPCFETIDYDLDKYHSPGNNIILDSNNGYKYFQIDGLTITFFRHLENSINYHIVLCEIDQSELNDRGILYDNLLSLNPMFTFRF